MLAVSITLALWSHLSIGCQGRRREDLLDQARLRLVNWYTNPDLVTEPKMLSGVLVRLLEEDKMIGGEPMLVAYSEFNISGVEPVDVFNVAADMSSQTSWNQQVGMMKKLGNWESEGVCAWAMTFSLPVIGDRVFLQWQATDADFDAQEFWVVFSTHDNAQLSAAGPPWQGVVEAENFGAYHITKNAQGTHVVITQQANVHFFFPLPLHQILNWFPPAWSRTVDFVNAFSDRAKYVASLPGKHAMSIPSFMLRGRHGISAARLWDSGDSPKLIPEAGASRLIAAGAVVLVALLSIYCSMARFHRGYVALNRSANCKDTMRTARDRREEDTMRTLSDRRLVWI